METTYKNPPITQRTFTIWFELSEESFYGRLPAFEQAIKEQFPEKGARKNWALKFNSKDGTPDFSSVKPQVEIIHEFHKRDAKHRKYCNVELEPNRISFHLVRTSDPDGSAHSFEDLSKEVQQGMLTFLRILEPKKIGRLDLDYVNIISRKNTPSFVEQDGGIHIGQLLTVFNSFPTKYESITPPYDCQIGLALDKEQGYFSIVRVAGLQKGIQGASAIRVDLHAQHELKYIEISETNINKKLEKLHEYIMNLFNDIFTEEAKQAF